VLGLLIETVSREQYGEYIRGHIFEPLDMTNSFTSDTEAQIHDMATGYRRWFGLTVPSDLPYLQHAIPSGYIISTAEDMTHFLMAHLNEGDYSNLSILSTDGIAELHRPVAQSGNEYYGMGWVIGSANEMPVLWHHGSTPNFHSTMLIEPEMNRGIVVLTNIGLFQVWHLGVSRVIAEGIASILRDQSPSKYGLSISTRYVITDTLIVLITALIVLFFFLLPRWHKRLIEQLSQTSFTIARRVILPIVVDFT